MVMQLLMLLILAATACPVSHAQANTPPPSASDVRFAFGGNAAEIPAQFIGNLVFVPLRVNESQPSLFVLDSTAPVSSVDPERAAELGLTPGLGVLLELAGVQMRLPGLPAAARKNFAAEVGRPYEGALGQDFLGKIVVELDYARHTVRLYDPADYQYAGHGAILPLTFSGGMPVVPVKFTSASGKKLEANFVVDTTLDASVVISGRYAKAHGLHAPHVRATTADESGEGEEDFALARLKLFEMGGYDVSAPVTEFTAPDSHADDDPQVAGRIGGGMLRRFTVVFDYSRRRMILEGNVNFREDDVGDMSGISLLAGGPGLKRLEVVAVRRGGPGASAGIQPSDIIAGIDDEPAADLSLAEVRALFREPGRQHKLLLERHGQTITVTLRLRRLL